ncbi:MAG: hypothetical protein ACK50V_09440 [Alphaproteobacteria bacterium]|jgi:hypothetical protein
MKALLLDEHPLIVQPTLALCVGLNEAIILQQVHYWLSPKFHRPEKVFHGQHWTYNTYKQWQSQMPFFSLSTIRRAIGNLEEMGVLISFVSCSFRKKKYYRIDYDRLTHLQKESEVNTPSLENSLDQKKEKKTVPFVTREEDSALSFEANKGRDTVLRAVSKNDADLSVQWKEEIQMCEIFSKVVLDGRPLALYPERQTRMAEALSGVLGNDLDKWYRVCDNVTRSFFLMGESKTSSFKASLDWVIAPNNLIKILEGENYGIGDRRGYLESVCDQEEELRQSKAKDEARRILEDETAKELSLIEEEAWKRVAAHHIETYGLLSYVYQLKDVRYKEGEYGPYLAFKTEESLQEVERAENIKDSLWVGYPECDVWNLPLVLEADSKRLTA